MTQEGKVYDESDFDVLEGLEPVRQVPGMYTRTENPMHIIQEVLDNAADEAQNGHASRIDVIVHRDNSVTVADNGRGIPVGLHPTKQIPVVVLAYTKLHAGAKFRKGNSYQRSGGLHGVGVAVTNALSTKVEVEVKREGKVHRVHFLDGDREISDVELVGDCGPRTTGTRVRAWPNPKYFASPQIPLAKFEELLRSKAMLMPGVTVNYRNDETGDERSWCYKDGIGDYLSERIADLELVGEVFTGQGYVAESVGSIVEGDGAKWAIAWTIESGRGESYVNLIPTPLGGTHEAGLRAGLFEALKAYCEHHAMLPRGITLQAEDVWSHAQFILSAAVTNTQFQGQTKDKLNSREVVRLLSTVVRDPFDHWLIDHPEAAKKVAELAIRQATARARQGKVVEKRKSSGVATLPGKLTDCESTDITRNELFLVEGDSAGGSAKQARNREYQAILPLRGKILNTFDTARDQLFSNNEVHDISVAIGVDPHERGSAVDLSGLRYGKIALLTDADVDGSHIQTLLLTLFFIHFPELVERGHVYIAQPPLFRIDVGAQGKGRPARKIYCLDDAERMSVLRQLADEGVRDSALSISRFKGLGEMNPEQLRETTMHADTRRMLQVGVPDDGLADTLKAFHLLMAKGEAGSRRAWLEEKGDLAELDV
ncbi:type IIA DNA topoisomerase subunit B (plasmid) [Burkholderia vietnamiensis]|uniref:DNA topoisomerase 4 subunit B n=1 Tax=Burkholderia vietnamiensis (strain G4 / LMG 22486) TaxID=269482 RepID=A4JTQ3_BURVG|nr:DNA topoisomerase IV subunit B [Burkholderia vietnamiensis G4]MCB4350184.1 type IIA DNA topoisomerase subunit B [Burkholderia vietnamiensis]